MKISLFLLILYQRETASLPVFHKPPSFFESTWAACKHINEEVPQSKGKYAELLRGLLVVCYSPVLIILGELPVAIKLDLLCVDFWPMPGAIESCHLFKTCVPATLMPGSYRFGFFGSLRILIQYFSWELMFYLTVWDATITDSAY